MKRNLLTLSIIFIASVVFLSVFYFLREDWGEILSHNVKLFYYDENKDMGGDGNIECSRRGLTPVQRWLSKGGIENKIEETIKLLLLGQLTEDEREKGISTEYPVPGFSLVSVMLDESGELVLTFEDKENKTNGGSCRVSILWLQIEETALQFSEVKSVRFMPEELFQP